MRKNIILKSMLRQPIRTGLLIILIGIATFAFFMRTVEYITVRRQLHELNQLYRTIGFIRAGNWEDVSAAADIIENSPLVGFVDRRVGMEGVLKDIQNVDIAGMWRGMPNEYQLRITEAMFAARVEYINTDSEDFLWMQLGVYDVYFGYREHVVSGQGFWWIHMQLRLDLSTIDDTGFIYELEQGEVYIFRAAYYRSFAGLGIVLPRPWDNNPLYMRPLFPDGRWVYHIEDTSTLGVRRGDAFSWPPYELAYEGWRDNVPYELRDEVAFFSHHHSAKNLMFTRDMSAMQQVQPGSLTQSFNRETGEYGFVSSGNRIRYGRWLNYYDYQSANPVAAITWHFAFSRGVRVGDTIAIHLPSQQQLIGAEGWFDLVSVLEEEYAHTLEVEIVGIFDYFDGQNHQIFLPLSLMPEGIGFEWDVPGWNYPYHLPNDWFSFVLQNPRTEQEFMGRYRAQLIEMGLDIILFETGSAEFFAAIDPIILTITFNAIVFWVVLVLVLALVVFLFLQQRKKDMAIQQALGFTATRVTWRLVATVLVFSIPAIVIGGVMGWRIAHNAAEYTLTPLSYIIEGFQPAILLEYQWFGLLGAAVLVLLLAMVLVNGVRLAFVPVLSQLQGVWNRKLRNKSAKNPIPVISGLPWDSHNLGDDGRIGVLPKQELATSGIKRLANSLRFISRQILRAPVKSALGLLVALFFVFVLSWLQESIMRAEQGLDDLYTYTIITGQVEPENPFEIHPQRYFGDVIRSHTAGLIRDSGFAENFLMESGHFRSFVIPYGDGSFPRDWYEIIGYNRLIGMVYNTYTLDFLYAFNDIDIFMEDNYQAGIGGLEIEFTAGYGPWDFVFTDGERIPIIVPEIVLARRGVAPGDDMLLAYTLDSPNLWRSVPARIIGVHNGSIARPNTQYAVLLPVDALESMLRAITMFTTLSFTIDPAYNRDMIAVREYLDAIIVPAAAGLVPLRLVLSDQALHNLTGISRQTLLLLQMVYPIVLGASLIIAMGLSMFLMLQTAKSAAILHVVGTGKIKTAGMLLAEQFIVCLAGLIPGVVFLAVMGVVFSGAMLVTIGLYLAGMALGAVLGVVVVIKRPALALLQLKE